jgi:hypothetical protein
MASMLVITMSEVAALTIDTKTTVLDSRSATAARSDGEFKSLSLFKQNQTWVNPSKIENVVKNEVGKLYKW